MEMTWNHLVKSPGGPSARALAIPALVVVLAAVSGCVTIGPSGTATLPAESRFVRLEIPVQGTPRTYPAWRTQSPGPPILLLHAINGVSPEFLRFALLLEDWGYRVYLPSLYGDPIGGDPAYGYDKEFAAIREVRRSETWNPISTESTGPIADDIAPIERFDELHERLSAEGLSDRFTAFVLTPPAHPYVVGRQDWIVRGETDRHRKMLTPHSTFLDSENEDDLECYHAQLRRELDQAW